MAVQLRSFIYTATSENTIFFHMSESYSSPNLNIEGDANSSVVIVGDGNTVNTSYLLRERNPFGVRYQRNPYFTGRDEELTKIHQQLTQKHPLTIVQSVVISGLGGIGKTQTAVEYAYRQYYDHKVYETVFWVRADTEANLATDFASIADQLALPEAYLTQTEKTPAVRTWLTTHNNWLLIFDNADEPDQLIDFMPTNPDGRVLVTSRCNIFDQLGVEEPLALDVLPLEASVNLLIKRTRKQRTEENVADAIKLSQELGSLPLALEQASAFILRKKTSFSSYLRTYQKRGLTQLEKVKAKTGQYHSSVMMTWTISFEAITAEIPAAAALLKLSAFFSPDRIPYRIFTFGILHLEDALKLYLQEENNDEIDDLLFSLGELLALLSQYSLVKWEPELDCYSIHRLVQAVLLDMLTQEERESHLQEGISAIVAAYPGKDFQHWHNCSQLLPHWLQLNQHAQKTEFESKDLGNLLNHAGFFLKTQGCYREAASLYQDALALSKDLLGDDSAADSLNGLAGVYTKQGQYDDAENIYREALDIRTNLYGEEHADVACTLNDLAITLKEKGQYEESEVLHTQALDIRKKILSPEHADIAESFNNLGALHTLSGKHQTAMSFLLSALDIRRGIFGEQHPRIISSLNNLAACYYKQKLYSEATDIWIQSLEVAKEIFGDDSHQVAISLHNLANAYDKQGNYQLAESYQRQALEKQKKTLGDEHKEIAASLDSLAFLNEKLEHPKEAECLYKQGLEMRLRLLGEHHISLGISYNNLAKFYVNQKRYDQPEILYQKALKIFKKNLSEDHPYIKQIQGNLKEFRLKRDCKQ